MLYKTILFFSQSYLRDGKEKDKEPALSKWLSESPGELRVQGLEQTREELFPEYDPQANGSAEVGVKLLKGLFRILRS